MPAPASSSPMMAMMMQRANRIIPTLTSGLHKGQAGRIGVVGGSEEYTGAPYYAASSALRCGADLAFVFCASPNASLPIKSYSPELIVYPHLSKSFAETLPRLSAVVFGPGLGRDPEALKECALAIALARQHNLPIVLDGDALWLLKDRPDLVRGYARAIITPNAAEYARLLASAGIPPPSESPPAAEWQDEEGTFLDMEREPALSASKLSNWLGGVTVLCKGAVDVITDGKSALGLSPKLGSARRCGGQGDVLAGTTAVFLSWARGEDCMAAAFAAALLTRQANALAFAQHGRSMTTPDLIHVLGAAFAKTFEETAKCGGAL